MSQQAITLTSKILEIPSDLTGQARDKSRTQAKVVLERALESEIDATMLARLVGDMTDEMLGLTRGRWAEAEFGGMHWLIKLIHAELVADNVG